MVFFTTTQVKKIELNILISLARWSVLVDTHFGQFEDNFACIVRSDQNILKAVRNWPIPLTSEHY